MQLTLVAQEVELFLKLLDQSTDMARDLTR